MSAAPDLGEIAFSPGREEWVEYGPPGARERVGFHDYSALYAVPGLYERVFGEALGMSTAGVLSELYAGALSRLGRDPAAERVLDLGAGNGIGGELLRRLGAGTMVGLDREPAARTAAERDRPGVYADYVVADLAEAPGTFEALAAHDLTAVLAFSAVGAGHVPLELLAETVRRLLRPGGLLGFAVEQDLVPGFFDAFFARVDAERLDERRDYLHRRTAPGGEHRATAVLARLR